MKELLSPEMLLYSILVIILVRNLLEVYIIMRQLKVYNTSLTVPAELQHYMTEVTFHKARLYSLDTKRFAVFKILLYDTLLVGLELTTGFTARLWQRAVVLVKKCHLNNENEMVVSCMFMLLLILVTYLKAIPFELYRVFVVEEKHGFNKQTVGFFVKDQLKGFLVNQILTLFITAAIVFIVQRGGEHFFIWLWMFALGSTLIVLTIYPILIAPLYDEYTPLEEGELRTSIEELAASLKFPLTNLYVVKGSERSSHSNAYFYGLWNSKRIVLFDTLLLNKGKPDDSGLREEEKGKGCTNEEVLAVLGHELGHWKQGHMMKFTILMQINSLILFTCFSYCFGYSPLYEAIGFPPCERPIIVGLIVVATYVMSIYNSFVGFMLTMLSRHFEYQADEFSRKLGFAKQLERALIKLNLDNLSFPVHDWLYSAWYHSHPTLLQRLEHIRELETADPQQKKFN